MKFLEKKVRRRLSEMESQRFTSVFITKTKRMSTDQKNNPPNAGGPEFPAADTGNASNPSPHHEKMEPAGSNQLLDEGAEKYLREAGNIEDLPDAQDQQDMDETIEREK